MRTTLAIDDDMFALARERARLQKRSIGEVVSDMMRAGAAAEFKPKRRNGIPLLPVSNPRAVVTLEIVNALRDEAP